MLTAFTLKMTFLAGLEKRKKWLARDHCNNNSYSIPNRYGHAITDDVLNAMTQNPCSFLEVLDLSYSSEVTNSALGRFITNCPSLRYLRVYHCQMLTSALMSLIPSDSQVFVVANFFSLQRGGLVTSATSEGPWTVWSAPMNYSRTMSLDQSLQED